MADLVCVLESKIWAFRSCLLCASCPASIASAGAIDTGHFLQTGFNTITIIEYAAMPTKKARTSHRRRLSIRTLHLDAGGRFSDFTQEDFTQEVRAPIEHDPVPGF